MKKVLIINMSIIVMFIVLSLFGGLALYNVVRITNIKDERSLLFDMQNSEVVKLNQNLTNGGKYTISAIIEPANIVINDVNWEITWQSSSDLLTSNYVDMKATDDILAVELIYKQNFDIPLEVTCDLQYGNGKQTSATCVINCYERYSGTYEKKMSFNNIECSEDTDGNLALNKSFTSYQLDDIEFNSPSVTYNTSGTILVEKTETLYLELSEELKSYLKNSSLEYEDRQLEIYDFVGLTVYEVFIAYFMPKFEELESDYIAALNETENWFKIVQNVTGKYNDQTIWEETFSFYLTGFNVEYYKTLTSFKLSDSVIIF